MDIVILLSCLLFYTISFFLSTFLVYIQDKDSGLVNINGVVIHNRELYDKIFRVFKETNWIKVYDMTSTPNLLRWQIVKYLKEKIPELE